MFHEFIYEFGCTKVPDAGLEIYYACGVPVGANDRDVPPTATLRLRLRVSQASDFKFSDTRMSRDSNEQLQVEEWAGVKLDYL